MKDLIGYLTAIGDAVIKNEADTIKTAGGRVFRRVSGGTRYDREAHLWVQVRVWVQVKA